MRLFARLIIHDDTLISVRSVLRAPRFEENNEVYYTHLFTFLIYIYFTINDDGHFSIDATINFRLGTTENYMSDV